MAGWWDIPLKIVGSIAGGVMDNNAANKAADAQRKGQQDQINLAKDIYRDQRNLAIPGYMTGGAATNKLGAMFGIAPQNYQRAALGDPGSVAGSGSYDWNAYLQDPGLSAEWQKLSRSSKNPFQTPEEYAQWHWQNFGEREGRTLNQTGGGSYDPNAPTGGGGPQQGGGNALGDPLQDFWNSPYGKLATDQFLSVDNPAIKGAFATSGAALSGAQQKALAAQGRARAGGAFNDYGNALRSLSGMEQTAGSAISGAGNTYGARAGNALGNIGDINANKSLQLNANWKNALHGVQGAFY